MVLKKMEQVLAVFVFDGDPLDTLSSLVASQTGFSGEDIKCHSNQMIVQHIM